MKSVLRGHRVRNWLVVAALLGLGTAMAQAEPSLNQVYATAQAGKIDEAQVMIQQVLVSHPNSGKAYFIRAELFARQGKIDLARESLASADKYSPGLVFAKPEAVNALRAQLSARAPAKAVGNSVAHYSAPAAYTAPTSNSRNASWGLPLLLAGGVIVAGYFMFRKKTPVSYPQQTDYTNQNALSGPQGFGAGGGSMQPTYPQPGGYPQPAGSGLGGRIMGGVATGLAVGAGVMAAEAIGKSLMGGHNANAGQLNNPSNNDYQPIASNQDMGGANFGVNDSSSWDDAGSSGGGGDWDN